MFHSNKTTQTNCSLPHLYYASGWKAQWICLLLVVFSVGRHGSTWHSRTVGTVMLGAVVACSAGSLYIGDMTNGRLVKWPIGAKQGMERWWVTIPSSPSSHCAGEILLQESNNRQQLCVETFAVGRDGTCYLMDPEKCGAPTDWEAVFWTSQRCPTLADFSWGPPLYLSFIPASPHKPWCRSVSKERLECEGWAVREVLLGTFSDGDVEIQLVSSNMFIFHPWKWDMRWSWMVQFVI